MVAYTNAAKAKLLLDGVQVGDTKDYDAKTGIIYWDIPFKNGKLEVISMDATGKEVSNYSIRSSKQPYALKIVAADKEISSNGLAQVVVQVVDEDGVPVLLSDNELTCQVAGPGELLGLEASNNEDMSDYTDNKHRVFHGQILAYVQSNGKAGEIHLRFSSPWLKPAELTVQVK